MDFHPKRPHLLWVLVLALGLAIGKYVHLIHHLKGRNP